MAKYCYKEDCEQVATKALKLSMQDHAGERGVAFLSLYLCDEHATKPNELIERLIDQNWEKMITMFEVNGLVPPSRSTLEWEWAPIEEAEHFWEMNMSQAVKAPKVN